MENCVSYALGFEVHYKQILIYKGTCDNELLIMRGLPGIWCIISKEIRYKYLGALKC